MDLRMNRQQTANEMQSDLTEKTLATERKYTGKIISVDLLDIELPDGRKAKREVPQKDKRYLKTVVAFANEKGSRS